MYLLLFLFFQLSSDTSKSLKNMVINLDEGCIISPFNFLERKQVLHELENYLRKELQMDSCYLEINIDLIGIIVKMSRYYEKKLKEAKEDIEQYEEMMENPPVTSSTPKSQEEALGDLAIGLCCCLIGFIGYLGATHEYEAVQKKAQWIYRGIILGNIKVEKHGEQIYSQKFVFINDKIREFPTFPDEIKKYARKDFQELVEKFSKYLSVKINNRN